MKVSGMYAYCIDWQSYMNRHGCELAARLKVFALFVGTQWPAEEIVFELDRLSLAEHHLEIHACMS